MKRIISLLLAVGLLVALALPAVAYDGAPGVGSGVGGVEILKKTGAKGLSLMGPPSSGPRPQAATGVLGEPVSGKRYAVVIGISDYPGDGSVLEGGYDLFYADDDAVAVAEVLGGIYSFEDIRLLLDGSATRDRILDEIASLKGVVTEDDEVVFYFSGHGARWMSSAASTQGGGSVGIVTWAVKDDDAAGFGYIQDREIEAAFSGFRTDRIAFIFDCCLAGGMTDLAQRGRVVCMATTQTGVAAEYGEAYGDTSPDPINHGLFTYFLVELGMMCGMADACTADGCVTVEEAFDFARLNLIQISLTSEGLLWQIPTIGDFFKGDLCL